MKCPCSPRCRAGDQFMIHDLRFTILAMRPFPRHALSRGWEALAGASTTGHP